MGVILSIDEGTTSVRAVLFDEAGHALGASHREFTQHFPRPGWVEHDADEVFDATVAVTQAVLADTGRDPSDVACIGITNQRETTVLFDRDTGRPLHHAIVWQDRRTAEHCDRLKAGGHADEVRLRTGLVVDAYFSGTKAAWLLDHAAGARDLAAAGRLGFATMDTWLMYRMSGGRSHVTEPSNASRTMLLDVASGTWSDEMLDLLGLPASMLPELADSAGQLARTDPAAFCGIDAPITGVAGDQQAALFGQGCWEPGMSKNTYGTGSFLLLNTGDHLARSANGLLSSIGWRVGGETTWVLEGAIFVTGATVQWLRDQLGVIDDAADVEPLARELPDGNEGVYLVPAFTGLGAPHWDQYARGTIVGMTRGTGRGHLARAAIEAMAYQTLDVARLMEREASQDLSELRVDGGASTNDLLCQFQADLLGVPVVRPRMRETTVLGAAMLAGLGHGTWSSTGELAEVWQLDATFEPAMARGTRDRLVAGWHAAVDRSRGWAHEVEQDHADG